MHIYCSKKNCTCERKADRILYHHPGHIMLELACNHTRRVSLTKKNREVVREIVKTFVEPEWWKKLIGKIICLFKKHMVSVIFQFDNWMNPSPHLALRKIALVYADRCARCSKLAI